MEPEITTSQKGIVPLVRMLNERRLLIPPFQREFVWGREDVLKLWDSIFRFYPIGSLLSWETPVYLHIHRRAGGRILPGLEDGKDRTQEWFYLLDGQQRATALLVSILGETPQVQQARDVDYRLYFDASDGDFFFEDSLKKRQRTVDADLLIRLKDVFDKGAGLLERVAAGPGAHGGVESNLTKLARIFKDYRIPMTHIRGFDIPDVREIFERINQEGKDLKSLDIMIARSFRDYDYLVEDDFRH